MKCTAYEKERNFRGSMYWMLKSPLPYVSKKPVYVFDEERVWKC